VKGEASSRTCRRPSSAEKASHPTGVEDPPQPRRRVTDRKVLMNHVATAASLMPPSKTLKQIMRSKLCPYHHYQLFYLQLSLSLSLSGLGLLLLTYNSLCGTDGHAVRLDGS
jgi:hypothetical protein